MVMEPIPSYEDLVWLFEAEPTYPNAVHERPADEPDGWRTPWPYTTVTFRTVRAGYGIELNIEPAHEQIRLRLRAAMDGQFLVDLELAGVQAVGIDRTHGHELLRVDFADDAPAATLWLRMKPDVFLHWSYDSMS
ncbi:hypothetical protein [Dactylosporangium sp. NPDC000521]|uniref:hypothetical protein n=1 Tax=Dactylosporangium sp. NPDC000521 TaxID=3363975 RepID=UPI0036B7FD75